MSAPVPRPAGPAWAALPRPAGVRSARPAWRPAPAPASTRDRADGQDRPARAAARVPAALWGRPLPQGPPALGRHRRADEHGAQPGPRSSVRTGSPRSAVPARSRPPGARHPTARRRDRPARPSAGRPPPRPAAGRGRRRGPWAVAPPVLPVPPGPARPGPGPHSVRPARPVCPLPARPRRSSHQRVGAPGSPAGSGRFPGEPHCAVPRAAPSGAGRRPVPGTSPDQVRRRSRRARGSRRPR